jgi:CRP-like cAMP-binding protein
MPLTQTEIGDVVGLTPIHVNRVMKDLKTRGIIEVKRRFVTVHDQAKLRAIADSDQLH